jgi:hypothetical protein
MVKLTGEACIQQADPLDIRYQRQLKKLIFQLVTL